MPDNPSTAHDLAWQQLRPVIDESMDQLSRRDRDALLLRFFKGYSFPEVGEILGLSENGARMRVNRSLEKMRTLLGKRGVESTTAALSTVLTAQAVTAAPTGLATAATAAALASATSVGTLTTVQSILNFMSTTKLGLGIAGMVTLFAVGSAVFEGSAASQAQTSLLATQASLAAATAAHKSDLAKQQQLARIAADDDQKWAALQKTVADMQFKAAQYAEAGPNRKTDKAAALAAGQAFLAAYPQARTMLLEIRRAVVAQLYGAFFQKAGLTPAQIENLENQTDEQWLQTIAVGPTGIHSVDQLPDDRVKAILGDQGFQQFQDFERVQPLQSFVHGASSAPSVPITETQANQLLMILANASSSYQDGGNASLNTVNWDQAMVQAQGVLSAQQIAAIGTQAQVGINFGKLHSLVAQFQQGNPPAK